MADKPVAVRRERIGLTIGRLMPKRLGASISRRPSSWYLRTDGRVRSIVRLSRGQVLPGLRACSRAYARRMTLPAMMPPSITSSAPVM